MTMAACEFRAWLPDIHQAAHRTCTSAQHGRQANAPRPPTSLAAMACHVMTRRAHERAHQRRLSPVGCLAVTGACGWGAGRPVGRVAERWLTLRQRTTVSHAPVTEFQRRSVPSIPPVAMRPSRHATPRTGPSCPISTSSQEQSSMRHTRTLPSREPLTCATGSVQALYSERHTNVRKAP